MFYPRLTRINGKDVLVNNDQCIGYKEHMADCHRILFLSGVITAEMDNHNLLMALDTLSHDPIRLIITSPGGDLDSTFLLYDTLKMLQSPVETVGRYCSSGAAILLAAGSKRYLFPHAKVMLHLPSIYFSKDSAIQIQDMEIIHKESLKYKQRMVNLLRECGAKKTQEEILADIDRDFWLEPDQAIDYGLADEIMTKEIWANWIKEEMGK